MKFNIKAIYVIEILDNIFKAIDWKHCLTLKIAYFGNCTKKYDI
jgi:hypothetical protein